MQPARRVENDDLDVPRPLGLVDRVAADLQGTALGRVFAVDRHADLLADDLELIDGGRSLQVGGDEHRLDALLLQHLREFAAGRRLAASLQTAHHQDRDPVPLDVQRMVDRAHQVDELVVDDADDLLARLERLQHLFADRLFGNPRDELLGDFIVDVGLEQGLTDLAQTVADIRIGQTAAVDKRQRAANAVCNRVKHGQPAGSNGAQTEALARASERTTHLRARSKR